MNKTDDELVQVIWDYMKLNQDVEKADLIFGLGSHDIRTAKRAAELYLQGLAPKIVFSGNEGVGRKISGFNGIPEAIHFKNRAIELGVPEGDILTEEKATNTGENITLTYRLLSEVGINADKIIAV